MTGFSVVPLQLFSMLGMVVSLASALLVVILAARRLIVGPEEVGLFTLFGVAFFFIGVACSASACSASTSAASTRKSGSARVT